MRMGRPCPVTGCDGRRDAAQVMCQRCWYEVPQRVRENVWRVYRAYGAFDDRAERAREAAIAAAERAIGTREAAAAAATGG